MGNRTHYPAQSGASIGRDYVEIKIQGGGAGAPKVLAGASFLDPSTPVTHAGGGNAFVFKMRDQWPEVVLHSCDVRDDAGNGSYASVGNFTNEGSTASGASGAAAPVGFTARTFTSGGAALNDSTLVIVIGLAIRNSSTTYGN